MHLWSGGSSGFSRGGAGTSRGLPNSDRRRIATTLYPTETEHRCPAPIVATLRISAACRRRQRGSGSVNKIAVRQYAGPLDVQRLARWVATVKLLSRIAILQGAQI